MKKRSSTELKSEIPEREILENFTPTQSLLNSSQTAEVALYDY